MTTTNTQQYLRTMMVFIMLAVLAFPLSAQSFKLYYAQNVNDVAHVTPTKIINELDWREVKNGDIDGNQVEVEEVKAMLASTAMKGRTQQEQFWRMRDHTLLCFRINTGRNKNSYTVEVDYGKNEEGKSVVKTLTTNSYFFANIPRTSDFVNINVWTTGDPDDRVNFRYWVYDWDDENVYLFQLDQKRQSTGDTYKMEYVTTSADADGDLIKKSQILELKETYFHSFYVPEGHALTDVYLLSGNTQEGDVKLRMNMEEIHPRIDISSQLDIPKVTQKFGFDKHANREMVRFNWIGTGLFEKYDTLYLKLFDYRGKVVTEANMNVHRVDEKGNYVADNTLRYVGYDKEMEQHKILTFGHPAYIEILAQDCMPTLYRYAGSANKETKLVDSELCSARLSLKAGDPNSSDVTFNEQRLRYLNDQHAVVEYKGDDHTLCDVAELDLTARLPAEKVSFMDNGGCDDPKLLGHTPVERFAQLELAFSVPKGGYTPHCTLTTEEVATGITHTPAVEDTYIVAASTFSHFTRDYYFVRYDLTEAAPRNQTVALSMTLSRGARGALRNAPTDITYTDFPQMLNVHANPDQAAADVGQAAQQSTDSGDQTEHVADSFHDSQSGLNFAPTFKFKVPGGSLKSGLDLDFKKQVASFFVSFSASTTTEASDKNAKLSNARKRASALQNWNYLEFEDEAGKTGTAATLYEVGLKYDDWVAREAETIFDVSKSHMGPYWAGGWKMKVQAPIDDFKRTQLKEATGYIEGGYGYVWGADSENNDGKLGRAIKLMEKIGLRVGVGFVFDAGIRFDCGLKTFDSQVMSLQNTGLFATLGITGRVGAWADIKTKACFLGSFNAGIRAGAKASVKAGVATPLDLDVDPGIGAEFMLLAVVQAYANLRTPIFHWSGTVGLKAGKKWLIPDDNTNPFHDKFPYWLSKTRSIANSFRHLRAPAAGTFGKALITDVPSNANPHFLNDTQVVFDDMGKADDYNDDAIMMVNTAGDSRTTVSQPGTAASQHMRSKIGRPEVVVYQQMVNAVDGTLVSDKTSVSLSNEQQQHTQIKAAFRQPDGSWVHTDVTPDDGYIDQKPVVTMQEDGHAACVYQHGTLHIIDPDESPDSAYNYRLDGELMLRTYDGTQWSEPVPVFFFNKYTAPLKYDLFMRNDTVLVGMSGSNLTNGHTYFRYISKPLGGDIFVVDDPLNPIDFFMNRVGEHAVVAMLYEKSDGLRDVHVKTVNMDGQEDGCAGCDLGLTQCSVDRIKVVFDRADSESDDFAILWTELNNVVRDPVEGSSLQKDLGTMLHASRIHLDQGASVTAPITLGSDQDNLLLTDFDGYLEDASIQVVYTLTDPESCTGVLMHNEKEFTNSFESSISYTRNALLGSSTLPVNVTINNTGTSGINGAEININGEHIVIPDVYVAPLSTNTFTVEYPIPDNFDGYMSSEVTVTYDNVFKARMGARRRVSLVRQLEKQETVRVLNTNLDCDVVARNVENGANTFVVELTDLSSRGMPAGTGVLVGVHPHPGLPETLTGHDQTLVKAEDFKVIGGVRRAYAEICVDGITEPIPAYIVPKYVDLEDQEGQLTPSITNVRAASCTPFVTLLPDRLPTRLRDIKADTKKVHKVSVSEREDGVCLSGLASDANVRIFDMNGFLIYSNTMPTPTLNVPLQRHGVYVLSTGTEIFKFDY